MTNFFKPTDWATYYWNNLKPGTYTFKFILLGEGESLTIDHKYDYFKYYVKFISSNVNFFNNATGTDMYIVLPRKGFEIALNLYKDRDILNKLKDDDRAYVTIFKKNKKIMRILDIAIFHKEERENYTPPIIEDIED